MKEIIAYGEIKNGGFYPRNSNVYMQSLKDAGTVNECKLTIKGKNVRSPDQNNYAFAMCNVIKERINQNGWNFTSYNIYKKIEFEYCKDIVKNEKTGKTKEVITELKKKSRERFWEIIEQARIDYMQRLDIHIKTPAQYYGLTEQAYDLWKSDAINFSEAKRMSND